jgi:hypothetical protein
MRSDLRKSYRGVRNIFTRYWVAYGKWKAVLYSPYFHAAIILTVMLAHSWLHQPWWKGAIGVLPTMVGFAIGAYAIVLGFGDDRFRAVIMTRRAGKTSPYVTISASFAHFIVVQLGALLACFLADGLDFPLEENEGLGFYINLVFGGVDFVHTWMAPVGYFVGFLLYMYAMTTALATSMAIFRLTTLAERDEPPKSST